MKNNLPTVATNANDFAPHTESRINPPEQVFEHTLLKRYTWAIAAIILAVATGIGAIVVMYIATH